MIYKKTLKGFAVVMLTALFSLSTIQSAYAQPGTLSNAPLFLSTLVEPNLYFSFDDSGSMFNDTLYNNGTAGIPSFTGIPLIKINNNLEEAGSLVRQFGDTDKRYIPPALVDLHPKWEEHWPVFNHEANRLYYNPDFTYTPWAGRKADGTAMYENADPLAVKQRPWEANSNTVNIAQFHTFTERYEGTNFTTDEHWYPTYFTWTDSNGNGQMDKEDDHTRVEIAVGDTIGMQNFANFLQYWRSRMHAAKAVLGNIADQAGATRMGMNFFNEGATFNVASMTDANRKRQLLELLYRQGPGGGTPTRATVKRTGEYFRRIGGGPILPAAQGGECQQNFSVVLTDGFWKGGNPGFGNNDTNGAGPYDGNASQSNDGGNYADGYSDTMADATMNYYENDLRPDLANNVPTKKNIDEAPHQHLVTYTIAFGIQGTLDSTQVDPTDPGFVWPRPVRETETTVDDLWHAAYNSRGQFLAASDPGVLIQSLNDAVNDIAGRVEVSAAASINSTKLTEGATVFLASFDSNDWRGDLKAFEIADQSTGELEEEPNWSAAGLLDARAPDNRVVLSYDGADGIPFRWDKLAPNHIADLLKNPAGGDDSLAVAEQRLEYIRGDEEHEGTGLGFRERVSILGDIVNSGPVFVGAPALSWPDSAPFPTADGTRYSDYANGTAASRAGVVYVGANDGMLHGFAESDGKEVIAYVPNLLFSTTAGEGLHYLTDPGYQHRYYNDLTPTVSDIYANLGSGDQWSTILVSGLRGGGRGIYALDVTDPNSFSEANAASLALWEFTNADDPNLGFTYSRPEIALANNGQWVAIFGNGYNDTGVDGTAKLFILDIEKGIDGTWSSGDYVVLDTGIGDPADHNGLSPPTLADLDGNGTVDRVYAGDLRGNLHWFDLSDPLGAWSTGRLAQSVDGGPITAAPSLARHPVMANDATNPPNLMVYFGSGQYLTSADKTTTTGHHFHGVWDRGDDLGDSTATTGKLVEQTYEPGFGQRVLTNNNVNYAGGDYGWYFDLPASGERSVTRAVVRGDLVFFNSFVPVDAPCSAGGFGFRFAVRLDTGGSPDEASQDTNGDGVIDDRDKANDGAGNTANVAAIRQEGFLPKPVFIDDIVYTAEEPAKVVKLRALPSGRFSWMELIQ